MRFARAVSTITAAIRPKTRRKTGAALLILTSSYYLVELIVAARWPAPPGYSWSRNMISDLGVPECLGDYGGEALSGRFICSPWHALMSAEFVLLGISVLAAAILLKPQLPKAPLAEAITYLALINCLGNVLVGVFPGSASEVPGGSPLRAVLHPTGAYLELFAGIAIMAIIAWLYRAHRGYTVLTLALLAASFLGMIASVTNSPLGAGAAERLAIDPFVCWRIITGVVVLVAVERPANR